MRMKTHDAMRVVVIWPILRSDTHINVMADDFAAYAASAAYDVVIFTGNVRGIY